MIQIRKEHRAFGWGAFELLEVENRAVLAIVRTHGHEILMSVHNLSGEPQPTLLDLRLWRGVRVEPLLARREIPTLGGEPYSVMLDPYEYFWLKIEAL